MQSVTEIKFGPNFKTDKVNSMSFMFAGCKSLNTLDLSSFDIKNVEFMSNMFNSCSSLKQLDLRHFEPVRLICANCIFKDCFNLTNENFGDFSNLENVKYNSNMFDNCLSMLAISSNS